VKATLTLGCLAPHEVEITSQRGTGTVRLSVSYDELATLVMTMQRREVLTVQPSASQVRALAYALLAAADEA
jgi:hypothetical protein